MQSASLSCMAFGLLATVGCYAPYGYQSPYGPGPYGQPYMPAPVYPNAPYVPGGSQPGIGTPTPITPNNPPSTYDNGGNGPIKFDGPDPGYDPNPAGSPPAGNSGGNRVVPNPNDDLGPSATKPGLTPTGTIQRSSAIEEDPFGDSSSSGAPAQPAKVESEPELFFPPERSSSVNTKSSIQQVKFERPASEPNPYGRDTKHPNPQWLRGVVDFDSRERTWQIIYSATPDQNDPNGGTLTLASHPALSGCRSGDIVLVEGAINAGQTDKRGKPLYALDSVTPLSAP